MNDRLNEERKKGIKGNTRTGGRKQGGERRRKMKEERKQEGKEGRKQARTRANKKESREMIMKGIDI